MLNYAHGEPSPRKVYSADHEPQPPVANPRPTDSIKRVEFRGIDYSDSSTSASRRGQGKYFDLDAHTKLPVPMDKGGFFRVSTIAESPDLMMVEYRVRRSIMGIMGAPLSRTVECVIAIVPEQREASHEDILSAALHLMERRKSNIENSSKSEETVASVDKLCGDYVPKVTRRKAPPWSAFEQ